MENMDSVQNDTATNDDLAHASELNEAEAMRSDRAQKILDPKYRWYIVNTYSGSEETVRLALIDRIRRAGAEDDFGDVFVPRQPVEKVGKNGQKKIVEKTSFPGYILIQMAMGERSMGCVTGTPMVTGFVGNRRNPRPLPEKDVLNLLMPEESKLAKALSAPIALFQKSEKVRVIDGPFTNFDGVIEEVKPEKMKLKVLVSIFGRETPVELAYHQVETSN